MFIDSIYYTHNIHMRSLCLSISVLYRRATYPAETGFTGSRNTVITPSDIYRNIVYNKDFM